MKKELTEKAFKALEEIAALSERARNDRVLECIAYEAEGMRKALKLIEAKQTA